MIRSRGRRFGALFLLTAFLAGGFGLSDLDAALFHSSPSGTKADQAHFDQPGGCGSHSEQCVLALATARVQAVASGPVKVGLPPVISGPAAPATPVYRSIDRSFLQHSRAPPRASTR